MIGTQPRPSPSAVSTALAAFDTSGGCGLGQAPLLLKVVCSATVRLRTGDFAYSTDGRAFTDLVPVFTVKFGRWTGDRLGFFSWNDIEAAGHVDVDYFH